MHPLEMVLMSDRAISTITLVLVLLVSLGAIFPDSAQRAVLAVFPSKDRPEIDAAGHALPKLGALAKYVNLASINKRLREAAFAELEADPHSNEAAIVLNALSVTVHTDRKARLFAILRKETGQNLPEKADAWCEWLWQARLGVHPLLREVKLHLYGDQEPVLKSYFEKPLPVAVPLDEIVMADYDLEKVMVLRKPQWISADQANYLGDADLVSAIDWPGDPRSSPGECSRTSCLRRAKLAGNRTSARGTAPAKPVAWKSSCQGTAFHLAVSGVLHRTTLLLADDETRSLWSVATGRTVLGPLAGKKLQLEPLPLVATTWGERRKEHPQTQVLAQAQAIRKMDADD